MRCFPRRFSIRALLLLLAIISVAFGWFAHERSRNLQQEQNVAELRRLRAVVWYDYQLRFEAQRYANNDVNHFLNSARDSRAHAIGLSQAHKFARPDTADWLRTLLGSDYGSDVSLVFVDHYAATRGNVAGVWKLLGTFPRLSALDVQRLDLSQVDLQELQSLGHLAHLQLNQTRLSDQALSPLAQAQAIEHLDLCENLLDGTILDALAELPRLVELNLSQNPIDPKNLRRLREFRSLRYLNLEHTSVGDESVHDLLAIPNLRTLNLNGTKLTDDGVRRLLQHPELESLSVYDAPLVTRDMHWLVQDRLGSVAVAESSGGMSRGPSMGGRRQVRKPVGSQLGASRQGPTTSSPAGSGR